MNKLKILWQWLNGKKRTFALYYWTLVMPILLVLYPVQMPMLLFKIVSIIGIILSSTGLGHSFIKAYQDKQEQENIEKISKLGEL